MQDRPTAQELVAAVRDFLERDVQPALSGRLAFHTRVAVNVLAIVARELELDPMADAAQHARLVEILGHDAETTRALETELAQRIRAGELGDDDSRVHAHVRATVAEKLAQSNPKY